MRQPMRSLAIQPLRQPNYVRWQHHRMRWDWSVLREEIANDPTLSKLKADLLAQGREIAGYYLNHGQLLYKGRLVIPKSSSMIDKLMYEYHTSAIGGHNREYKTYLRLVEDWYWEGMRKAVSHFVRQCVVCQQHKTSHQ